MQYPPTVFGKSLTKKSHNDIIKNPINKLLGKNWGYNMSRASTKDELLEFSEINLDKLLALVNEFSDEVKNKTFENNEINERDKTVSDVICHLHEWHLMMENWYRIGMAGKTPAMPMEGYNWKQLTEVNKIIWNKYKGTALNDAMDLFKKSHKKLVKLIEKHSNEELFGEKKYEWTGKTALGRYFDSNTSNHYEWGIKTLKGLKKRIKE
jgi:hypothetical protein